MIWNDNLNWTENIRNILKYKDECDAEELLDAFMKVSFLYATEFINLKLMEDYITETEGEDVIESIVASSSELDIIAQDETMLSDELEVNLLEALNTIEGMY